MGRGGSGGGGGRAARFAAPPASARPSARRPSSQAGPFPPKVQKDNATPPPAQGGLLGAVADGIGWGAGNAIAHRAVDAVVGPRTIRHETVASESAPSKAGFDDACNVQSKAFQDCLNGNGNEISMRQVYMDMLVQCKRNSGSLMSS